jgi:hypothetical protein
MSPIQNNLPSAQYQHHAAQQQQQQQQLQMQNYQQMQQQQPQHVFLPPTSPAVRPSSAIPPSPIHNYLVQSPGGVTSQISSIAPSPGSFPNFGSPALISHSSPSAPHISHAVPSPGGFMSPAPQSSYSAQSPASYGTFKSLKTD